MLAFANIQDLTPPGIPHRGSVPAALTGRIGMVSGLLINEAGGLAVIANGLRLLKREG
jgi:hypothetical protein